jgi:hypothetical protein
MFCPKCRDEFVPGIEECPDCKVPLVEVLPESEQVLPHDVELVCVLETRDTGELMVAKSLLESEGIRYIVFGDGGMQHYLGQGSGMQSYLIQPIRLMVSEKDAIDAKNLLSTDN